MINNTTAAIRKLKLKILSVASHRHVVSFLKVGVVVGADRRIPPPQKIGKFANHENPNP